MSCSSASAVRPPSSTRVARERTPIAARAALRGDATRCASHASRCRSCERSVHSQRLPPTSAAEAAPAGGSRRAVACLSGPSPTGDTTAGKEPMPQRRQQAPVRGGGSSRSSVADSNATGRTSNVSVRVSLRPTTLAAILRQCWSTYASETRRPVRSSGQKAIAPAPATRQREPQRSGGDRGDERQCAHVHRLQPAPLTSTPEANDDTPMTANTMKSFNPCARAFSAGA